MYWESYYGVPIKRSKKTGTAGKAPAKAAPAKAKKAPAKAAEKPADKPADAAATTTTPAATPAAKTDKLSRGQRRKAAKRVMDPVFEENILAGRVYAMVSFLSHLYIFVSFECWNDA
eukprot:Phypoly_transcript_13588.p1 GENE.Phypoly_transcript_13588~~Phypoly_transcript_13588.p1  ORF type:complete len:117 (+),score=26.49 Phypoly_transcript_13588:452-802(+)